MFSNEQPTGTNYKRRILGVILSLLPLEIAIASLLFGLITHKESKFSGIKFVYAGTLFAALNFYLHFFRPRLHKLINRSMEKYRNVSGLPLIGELLVTIGTLHGFGSVGTALLGIFATVLNTGGSLWFLIWTWKDKSLWDRK
jgi:hypothetical protein